MCVNPRAHIRPRKQVDSISFFLYFQKRNLPPILETPTIEKGKKSLFIEVESPRMDHPAQESENVENTQPYKPMSACELIHIPNIPQDALRLRLFSYSLHDKARDWLTSLPHEITTWLETHAMRKIILQFTQKSGEAFHKSWERFKELQRKYTHHEIAKWQLNRVFYDGISEQHKNTIDAACGGTFMSRDEDEIYKLYENLSENLAERESFALYDRNNSENKKGIFEVRNHDALDIRYEFQEINTSMMKMMEQIRQENQQTTLRIEKEKGKLARPTQT
ncbi:unnamed protein product [Spirodela intermedia]|uniref:Uncharacterized protein n=1 Tax=Spirodela intermedia TaxID=51605 RepID=A0A7I8JS79_SPIIN|nr:unnamed protein product [Spirodela intermedia]CAA6672282.1 unnamed protein product [Spirodela intermedia]